MASKRRITPKPVTDKEGTVRWRVRFRYDDGGSASRTFDDPQSAETFITLLTDHGVEEALDVLGEWSKAKAGAKTVTQWCNSYIDDKTGVQKDTQERYRRYVKNDFTRWQYLPVGALTQKLVNAWIQDQIDSGVSAKTIANKHGFLADAMKAAHEEGQTAVNPCAKTRLPRTEARGKTFLTHDEYTRFLEFFTPHWQPMVATMFGTGARFGEISALRVADVDLAGASVSITRAWKRGNELGAPKSRKSVRTVPIAPETISVLTPLVEDRSGDEWLFLNQRGGPVRHPAFLENAWNPAVRLANGEPAQKSKRISPRRDAQGREFQPAKAALGKRPTIHDARHTYASWLLAAGVPINVVQACLGHESVTTTVDTYGHIMPHARLAVSGAISEAMATAHPQIEG